MQSELIKPIVGINLRSAQEIFDIMVRRIEAALSAAEPVTTVAEMGAGGMRVLMPHPPGSTDHLHIGTKLYAAPPAVIKPIIDLIKEYSEDAMPDSEYRLACNDLVEAVSALSAQVQDVAGWRPIETAPKDESIIMLFRADEKHWASISTGYFKNDRFARNPKPYWGGPHERSLGIRWYRENPPTHWMPLPAAPAKQEGGK